MRQVLQTSYSHQLPVLSCAEKLGAYILDPVFPFYMCDVDLSKRMIDRGYKVYFVPEAKAVHLKTASVIGGKRGSIRN